MTAMAFITATVFLISIYGLISDAAEEERLAAINQIAYAIQDEIILATEVEDGYERDFYIPNRAGQFVFTLEGTESSITITSGQLKQSYTIPTIDGVVKIGTNRVRKMGSIIVT